MRGPLTGRQTMHYMWWHHSAVIHETSIVAKSFERAAAMSPTKRSALEKKALSTVRNSDGGVSASELVGTLSKESAVSAKDASVAIRTLVEKGSVKVGDSWKIFSKDGK